MFGYITADAAALSPEQLAVYRSYYCGLCRCIGTTFGSVHRIVLNYDMTFLVMLHSALYDMPQEHQMKRCLIHPAKPHVETINDATHYAAAMNLLLSYHKCVDDWQDDRSLLRLMLAKLLTKQSRIVCEGFPEKVSVITACLEELSQLEQENSQDPDRGSALFGQLLGEVFVWRQDRWAENLRKIGDMLGRYIYLVDAILDLPGDIKKGRYNPLTSRWSSSFDKSNYIPVLQMILGECAEAFEQLPLTDNTDILRNILYSGVWTKFYQEKHIPHKEKQHV